MKNRILSMLLCMLMLFSMFPYSVIADETAEIPLNTENSEMITDQYSTENNGNQACLEKELGIIDQDKTQIWNIENDGTLDDTVTNEPDHNLNKDFQSKVEYIDIPEQVESGLLVFTDEYYLSMTDFIDFKNNRREDYILFDGKDVSIEVKDAEGAIYYMELAEFMTLNGYVYSDVITSPGNYYTIVTPAENSCFVENDAPYNICIDENGTQIQFVYFVFTVDQIDNDGIDPNNDENIEPQFDENYKTELISGDNQTWEYGDEIKDEDPVIFSFSGRLENFLGLSLNGIELAQSEYSYYTTSESQYDVELDAHSLKELTQDRFINDIAVTFFFCIGEEKPEVIDASLTVMNMNREPAAPEYSAAAVVEDTESIYFPTDNSDVTVKGVFTYSKVCNPNAEKYTLISRICSKDDTGAVYILQDENGNDISTMTQFVGQQEGKTELERTVSYRITVPAAAYAGNDIVLLNELYYADGTEPEAAVYSNDIYCLELDVTAKVNGFHVAASDEDSLVDIEITTNGDDKKDYDCRVYTQLFDIDTDEPVSDEVLIYVRFNDINGGNTISKSAAEIHVNGEALAGKTIRARARLESPNNKPLGEYNEINEKAEVCFARITGTEATVSGLHIAEAKNSIVIDDDIFFENLIPDQGSGVRYVVETLVQLIENGELQKADPCAVSTSDAEISEKDGSTRVQTTLDASELLGKTIVLCEKLYVTDTESAKKILIGSHRDETDIAQMISFPRLSSLLTTVDGSRNAPSGRVSLVDNVSYYGLIPNETYKMKGWLTDPETGSYISAENSPVVSEVMFTPTEENGTVSVPYELDAAELCGKAVVANASVICGETVVATHADSDDLSQTIYFSGIATNAHNGDYSKTITAAEKTYIIDDVEYTGVMPFSKLKLEATVFNLTEGAFVQDKDGSIYSKAITFTPTKTDSKYSMILQINTSKYVDADFVVFETLSDAETGEILAVHNDENDREQTVSIPAVPIVYVVDATTGEPVASAVVHVTDETTGKDIVLKTGEEGIGKGNLVKGHQYSIQEIEVPGNYVIDPNIYYFSVNADGSVLKDAQTIYNHKEGVIILTKRDVKSGSPIAGATIAVNDIEGNTVFTQITDRLGRVYFNAAEFLDVSENTGNASKSFTFKETKAPSGYYLDTATHKFTVSARREEVRDDKGAILKDENNQVITKTVYEAAGETTMVECPIGTVKIKKTDIEGNPLAGARISVYSGTGTLLGQSTTNSKGCIYFTAPAAGNYYFIEDQAPSGYVRNDVKYMFAINQYGVISGTTTFTNAKASGSDAVQTGDTDNIAIWLTLSSFAVLGIIVIFIYTKKRSKEN